MKLNGWFFPEDVVVLGSSKHGGARGAFLCICGGGDGVLERAGAEAAAEVTGNTRGDTKPGVCNLQPLGAFGQISLTTTRE